MFLTKTRLRTFSGHRINASLIGFIYLCWSAIASAEELNKQEKLKAAYLFNFSKYISWPAEAFTDESAPIHLCLEAKKEFVDFARELTLNRTVGQAKRPVKVLDDNNQGHCHIRYLTSNTHTLLPDAENTLVVSSEKGLNVPQTTIWFFREGSKLRFEIDLNKAQKLNLSISSELLKLARIK